jgi:hypothetical protein
VALSSTVDRIFPVTATMTASAAAMIEPLVAVASGEPG